MKRWIDRGNFFFSINKERFVKSLKKQKLLSLGAVQNSNKNIVLDSVLISLFYFCENLRELIWLFENSTNRVIWPNCLQQAKHVSIYTSKKRRLLSKRNANQLLGSPTSGRLDPLLPFIDRGIDVFWLCQVKWGVKDVEKGFGLIITCQLSRAVNLDFTEENSIHYLVLPLRRFINLLSIF